MIKKSLISIFLFVPLFAFSQGYNLKFNRVIDSTLFVNITACQDLLSSGTGTVMTVPVGCVWKVESVGPLIWSGQSDLYTSCGNSGYDSYATIWGVMIDDGSAEKAYLKRRSYNGSWVTESLDGTLWLRQGTSLQAVITTRNTAYKYPWGVSASYPLSIKVHVSVIEFRLIP